LSEPVKEDIKHEIEDSRLHCQINESNRRIDEMSTMTTIMRSGYYILRLLPVLAWVPFGTRSQLNRATNAFENELLHSGMEPDAAHQLADAFKKSNKDMVKQLTSPRVWMQIRSN